MKLFDFLSSSFPKSPINELKSKLKQEVTLKYQIEQTERVLMNFSKFRQEDSSKNIGLAIRGVEGVGKTRFAAKFLLDYFLGIGLIEQRLFYKFNNREFTRSAPSFKRVLDLTKNPDQIEHAFTELEPGGIIMLDDFQANSIHFPATLHNIKALLKTEEHAKTLVILAGAFRKLHSIRTAKFDIESIFPSEFELIINPPSLNQLTKMFIDYAAQKNFTLEGSIVKTLRYYFKIKKECWKMSSELKDKGHLNRDEVVNFNYASEFPKLLNSIKITDPNLEIDVAQIRQSPIFLETATLYEKLKQKVKT